MYLANIAVAASIIVTVSASPRPQNLPPTSDVKPQACLNAAQAIPTCGRQCLEQAATSVGCGVVDFTCSCPKQSAVASAATSCVLNSCSGVSAAEAVQSAAEAVCSCVNQQPAGVGSSSGSASMAASTPASSLPDPPPATSTTPPAVVTTPAQQQPGQQQPAQQQPAQPQNNTLASSPSTENTAPQSQRDTQKQQQPPAQQQQSFTGSSPSGTDADNPISNGGSLASLFGGGLGDLLSDFLV